jgi:uncharacterized protein YndB with AHSA1/START domain
MIVADNSTEIRRPMPDVFAMIDDFDRMPTWLESCVAMAQVTKGERAAGNALHYRYNIAGQAGEMDGTLTAYVPGEQIAMRFSDSHFDVEMGFRLEATELGARVYHQIGITIKFELARYMETMIQAGNKKQVGNNLARLKRILEAAGAAPVEP